MLATATRRQVGARAKLARHQEAVAGLAADLFDARGGVHRISHSATSPRPVPSAAATSGPQMQAAAEVRRACVAPDKRRRCHLQTPPAFH